MAVPGGARVELSQNAVAVAGITGWQAGPSPMGGYSSSPLPRVPRQLFSPVHVASSRNVTENSALEVVPNRCLHQHSSGLRQAVVTVYTADRKLRYAVYSSDLGRIRDLIEGGADVNTRDGTGRSILGLAVEDGDAELAKLLVNVGANVDVGTPLGAAIESGNTEIAMILVEAGADVNAKDPRNDNPWGGNLLDTAKWAGNPAIIKILTVAGAEFAWPDQEVSGPEVSQPSADDEAFYPADASGLREATIDGDADSARTLVEAGVNVNAKAAGGESIPVAAIIYQDDPEIVQILVDAGADVNAWDNIGRPVLWEAISPYDWGPDAKETLQILVNAGADVNATDADGLPELAEAIRPGNILTDYPEIVRVLVDAGADVNIDAHGVPIIFWALLASYEVYEGAHDILRMFIDAGAVVNA